MTDKNISIFSFFSGSGFLDLGFEMNGYKIVLVNEFHQSFIKAYQYARNQMGIEQPAYGYFNIDVNDFLNDRKQELASYVKEARNNGLVGFVGGPPCPDFSVAGKNRGKEGDNGKLSQSYVNLIKEFKPDFFLFENVKGLLRTARHRDFYEDLKKQMQAAGYALTDRLTNSLEFGAPQDRDRILLFGIDQELLSSPGCIDKFPWKAYMKYSLEDIKDLSWPDTDDFSEDSVLTCPPGIPEELTVEHWFCKNDVCNHPNAGDYFQPRSGRERMAFYKEGDDCKKSYKRLHRWRYSPTVAYGNNEVHLHPYKVRRLSVAEALSLQSLPKEFALPSDMTLTDKFKTVGNGVPYLLADGIAKTIKLFLEEYLEAH